MNRRIHCRAELVKAVAALLRHHKELFLNSVGTDEIDLELDETAHDADCEFHIAILSKGEFALQSHKLNLQPSLN